ncbi:hypothetical protein BDW68DRAFT_157074 [Aspergillus falconensis]
MQEVLLQVLLVSDIGYFAAEAFLKSEEYRGEAVPRAGDQLPFSEMAGYSKRYETGCAHDICSHCPLREADGRGFGMFKWLMMRV